MTDPNNTPLVSIIMAAYNAGPYIREAMSSALAQSHRHIELLVVNDGSTDDTSDVIGTFTDPRIVRIDQPNGGIGNARNAALDKARGSFICFLDADDVMPPDSVKARLAVFLQDPGLHFVDGQVVHYDIHMERILKVYTPSFRGEPLQLLATFDASCFFGNTWMIRWEPGCPLRFETSITHVEDLLFYLKMAKGHRYAYTTTPVLHYRITGTSSMSKLDGLERSYHFVHDWIASHPDLFDKATRRRSHYLVRRMMSGAYWHAGNPWKAVLVWFKRS
jgi:glycosyltransferase involved in cell wall biosynthesis